MNNTKEKELDIEECLDILGIEIDEEGYRDHFGDEPINEDDPNITFYSLKDLQEEAKRVLNKREGK